METTQLTTATPQQGANKAPLGVIDWDMAFVDYDIEIQRDHSGLKCGVKEIDNIFRLDRSQLAVFTGEKGNGKSTFLTYYSTLLARKNDLKVVYFDFEAPTFRTVDKLLKYYSNDRNAVKKHCLIIDNKINTVEDIINVIDSLKGIADMAIIDPFMSISLNGKTDTYLIGETLDKFRQCAIRNNIILALVAHTNGQILYVDDRDFPRSKNICGSSNFGNVSDCVIGIRRLPDNTELIGVDKLRYDIEMGKVDATITLDFNPDNKTYTPSQKAPKFNVYDYDNTFHEATPEMVKMKIMKAKDHEKK
jgi:energy-coupling factor transporter ATP-binding protein EcfA2